MFDMLPSCRTLLIVACVTLSTSGPDIVHAQSAPRTDPTKRSKYPQAVLASAPTAYWRLGESRGSEAHDATGRGNDGQYFGRPEFGQKGALPFDMDLAVGLPGVRTRSYVEVRDRTEFSIATSGKGLTVEGWMRPDSLEFKGEHAGSADDYIHWLGKGEKGRYEWGFRFYSRSSRRPNRISAYVWNPNGKLGAGAHTEDPLTVGAWIYLVATFDDPRESNAQVHLYKDGQPSPHNKSPGALYSSYHVLPQHGPTPLRLGTRDLRSFLTGGLDEVAIYPRVLKAEEISRHWKAALGK
jgi:concanavalin A-like lectin/glucanase superfamily protein